MSTQELTPTVNNDSNEPSKQRKRTGSKAKKRQEAKFRLKKNKQIDSSLRDSIMLRLGIQDPTTISSVGIENTVAPTVVPVTLAGIPAFLEELWARLLAVGPRPFSQMAADPKTKSAFFRTVMIGLEAKLAYAQRTTTGLQQPCTAMNTLQTTTLETIAATVQTSPTPVAVLLQSVGHVECDGQQVIPDFAAHEHPELSGTVNYSPSSISSIVRRCGEYLEENNPIRIAANTFNSLPSYTWDLDPQNPDAARLSEVTLEIWGPTGLPQVQRVTYQKITSALNIKPNAVSKVDIKHGRGTLVPLVRFPVAPNASGLLPYYINVNISKTDQLLAQAYLFGFEPGIVKRSRFCGDINFTLVRGEANLNVARAAVLWY